MPPPGYPLSASLSFLSLHCASLHEPLRQPDFDISAMSSSLVPDIPGSTLFVPSSHSSTPALIKLSPHFASLQEGRQPSVSTSSLSSHSSVPSLVPSPHPAGAPVEPPPPKHVDWQEESVWFPP